MSATPAANVLQLVLDENPDKEKSREARIYVKAGRLRHSVLVEQLPNTETPSGSANCYILKPGEKVLIPVSRANQGVPGSIGDDDVLTGGLVWTDNSLGLHPNSNISSVQTDGVGHSGYLIVEAGPAEGNAVVSVSVGGTIKWSWHIWVTNAKDTIEAGYWGNTDWMDRNLGAMGNSFVSWDSTQPYGVYFQWGRKDAFSTTNEDVYDENGTHYEWPTVPTVTTVLQSIEMPHMWTSNLYTNYAGSNGSLSWEDGGKTVWDPCPFGWRVPLSTYYSVLTVSNFPYADYGRWNDSVGGYYPFPTRRQPENGVGFIEAPTEWGANYGVYWTADASSTTSGTALRFSQYSELSLLGVANRTGCVVRCVRE